MDWLILGVLLILVVVVFQSRRSAVLSATAAPILAQSLDRIESTMAELKDELTHVQIKIESIEDSVKYCDESISRLSKRFNRIDPYYRQEVDPHGLLDDATLFGLKKGDG